MNFYEFYQLLNENIEQNFNNWLELLEKYAKPDEKEDIIPVGLFDSQYRKTKDIIISVLKEQNLENFNWFSFCMGYFHVKDFRKEDLEAAITITKKVIDSGELPKSEIGIKGWYAIGKESPTRIRRYLQAQNQISNREALRRKKQGIAELDDLVELVVNEKGYKIYFLPAEKIMDDSNIIKKRHEILCKLGKGTEWCTAQPSWDAHEAYVEDDIYIIHKIINNDEVPIYQFVGCDSPEGNEQFMDVDDQSTNYIPKKIYEILKKNLSKETSCYNLKIMIEDVDEFLNTDLFKNPIRIKDLRNILKKLYQINTSKTAQVFDKLVEHIKSLIEQMITSTNYHSSLIVITFIHQCIGLARVYHPEPYSKILEDLREKMSSLHKRNLEKNYPKLKSNSEYEFEL